MYITKLIIDKIRCFDHLEIDFTKPGQSVLLLGDNGDGKSTILKCIAIGLCDESSASALFRELPGEFVRRGPKNSYVKEGDEGYITITLHDGNKSYYRIKTTIKSTKTFERVFQDRGLQVKENDSGWRKLNQDNFPWEKIFVSGYGAGSRAQGTADFQHFLAVDAVYSIFKPEVPLQNPELVIRRLVEAARGIRKDPNLKGVNAEKVLNTVKLLLAHFLDLKDADQIDLTSTGIKVKGNWGTAELGELGDGYRSKITLILDLLAWWFLKAERKARTNIKDIRGIVLIDEIEQHLHPRWQRTILQLLQESFPQVQLIAATHSPLVASGSESTAVHLLQHGQHRIVKPYGWLAEDVYSIMGLNNTRSKSFISEVLDEYESLYEKHLEGNKSRGVLLKLKKLRKELAQLPESDPVSLTTEIMSITESLRRMDKQKEKNEEC